MTKILIAATVSYAGMGPYVCQIFNSFEPGTVYGFFVDGSNGYFARNISPLLMDRVRIVGYSSTKWHKLQGLIRTPRKIRAALRSYCAENGIDVIHILSAGPLLCDMGDELRSMARRVLVTVHDVMPHESDKAWYKTLRQQLIYNKLMRFYRHQDLLVTNSHEQERLIRDVLGDKAVYYHAFPSLVTSEVAMGQKQVPETHGLRGYILFFGRIEKYKGLDLLYQAYSAGENLRHRSKLVIAGAGDIYFDISPDMRDDVILINRYIDDAEIACLYTNAGCVVYPYISATQSGVLTLSCYFQVPTVASDVPFFREQVRDGQIARLFRRGDATDLARVLSQVLDGDNSEMLAAQAAVYKSEYQDMPTARRLMRMYEESLNGFQTDKH